MSIPRRSVRFQGAGGDYDEEDGSDDDYDDEEDAENGEEDEGKTTFFVE